MSFNTLGSLFRVTFNSVFDSLTFTTFVFTLNYLTTKHINLLSTPYPISMIKKLFTLRCYLDNQQNTSIAPHLIKTQSDCNRNEHRFKRSLTLLAEH